MQVHPVQYFVWIIWWHAYKICYITRNPLGKTKYIRNNNNYKFEKHLEIVNNCSADNCSADNETARRL